MSSEERREEVGSEEEIERGGVSAELVKGNILKIRWVTGKTSAARLFGKYGREGRPDFFRLLFGAIGGSLGRNSLRIRPMSYSIILGTPRDSRIRLMRSLNP